MTWRHGEPLPLDPNAPPPRSQPATQPRIALETPAAAAHDVDLLVAQLLLIVPSAGAELRRTVSKHGEPAAASPGDDSRLPGTANRPDADQHEA